MSQQHNPEEWQNIFKKNWGETGFKLIFDRYSDNRFLFELLQKDLGRNNSFMEIGAGRGINALITKMMMPEKEVWVTDYVEDHLNLFDEQVKFFNIDPASFHKKRIDIINDSISSDIDICLSDGVLEHFSKEEILKALKNMKSVKINYLIVPVNNADIDYGDEWIASYEEWLELIRQALPDKNVEVIPNGYKGIFFRNLRKIVPFLRDGEQLGGAKGKLNELIKGFEKSRAASACFKIS